MKRSRRVLQTVCEFLVAFVLVVMGVVGMGAITLPVAHVVDGDILRKEYLNERQVCPGHLLVIGAF